MSHISSINGPNDHLTGLPGEEEKKQNQSSFIEIRLNASNKMISQERRAVDERIHQQLEDNTGGGASMGK